jgi:hypothetical protein
MLFRRAVRAFADNSNSRRQVFSEAISPYKTDSLDDEYAQQHLAVKAYSAKRYSGFFQYRTDFR